MSPSPASARLAETPAPATPLARRFRDGLPVGPSVEPALARVLRLTLDHPGGLSRARLCFDLHEALGGSADVAGTLATAVEYWHSASLVLDDLPCMDDAGERRGQPCAHVVSGEASAILGALALINRAYALLGGVLAGKPAPVQAAVWDLVGETLGLDGVLNGQALDLAHDRRPHDEQEVLAVADGKTGALLRLALLLPALVAGGLAPADVAGLSALALAWGRIYQILDDFKDWGLGAGDSGKTPGRDLARGRPNMLVAAGRAGAARRLHSELERARAALRAWSSRPRVHARLSGFQSRFEAQAALVTAHAGTVRTG